MPNRAPPPPSPPLGWTLEEFTEFARTGVANGGTFGDESDTPPAASSSSSSWTLEEYAEFVRTGRLDGGTFGDENNATSPPPPTSEDAVAYFRDRHARGEGQGRDADVNAAMAHFKGALARKIVIAARKAAGVMKKSGPAGS
jgi:hypothetical protein